MNMKRGYAIVDVADEKMALFDGRMPIYWLKHVAKSEAERRGLRPPDYRIVRVEVHDAN